MCSEETKGQGRFYPHVHEVLGSTQLTGSCCEAPHNHRFATVTGDAIKRGNSHVHKIEFGTDTFDDHEHSFCGETSPAVFISENRHVHYIKGCTTTDDGHKHEFRVGTLIDNPIECR